VSFDYRKSCFFYWKMDAYTGKIILTGPNTEEHAVSFWCFIDLLWPPNLFTRSLGPCRSRKRQARRSSERSGDSEGPHHGVPGAARPAPPPPPHIRLWSSPEEPWVSPSPNHGQLRRHGWWGHDPWVLMISIPGINQSGILLEGYIKPARSNVST
jgi:hypothetical protein